MAISDKLTKLNSDLLAAYDAVYNKGGNVPQDKNTNNLSTAISSISGGSLQPTLYAPTVALDEDFCVITPNTSNGDFISLCSYEIYVDGVLTDTTTETRILLTSIITTGLSHTIKVKAISDYFKASDYSNEVTWTRIDGLKITSTSGGNDFLISINGTLDHNLKVWYWKSTTQKWVKWFEGNEGDSTAVNVPAGQYMYIWNETDTWSNDDVEYAKITVEHKTGSCSFSVSGSINSLINGTDASNKPYCFASLFEAQWFLTDASELSLPTKDLSGSEGCYKSMFYACTALTKAPELPATVLGERCYELMFCGCDALSQPPTTLPATTLAPYCYRYMFNDCVAMTKAPERFGTVDHPTGTIPANAMLNMFSDCPNLVQPPVFNMGVVRENACKNMFKNCTSLTVTNQRIMSGVIFTTTPQSWSIATDGLLNMFQGCDITSITTWVDGTPNPAEIIYYIPK